MVLRDFCLTVIKDLDPAGSDVRRADKQIDPTLIEFRKVDELPQEASQRVCAVETGPKWGRKVIQAHAKEAGVPEKGTEFLPSIGDKRRRRHTESLPYLSKSLDRVALRSDQASRVDRAN
jgi:hypothetical protein